MAKLHPIYVYDQDCKDFTTTGLVGDLRPIEAGEIVLNKSQARQFRDGNGGGADISGLINNAVSSAMSRVYVMMSGEKVGDLTTKRINRNINASSYNKLRAMGG